MGEDQLDFDKENHFTKMHPGMMMNSDELCEEDRKKQNLFGTSKIKGMEANYIDQYLETNKNANNDFYIYHEEMWNFLLKRYGGQTIQRFYIRKSNQLYTVVECRLKQITLKMLNCQMLTSNSYELSLNSPWWTQIS